MNMKHFSVAQDAFVLSKVLTAFPNPSAKLYSPQLYDKRLAPDNVARLIAWIVLNVFCPEKSATS